MRRDLTAADRWLFAPGSPVRLRIVRTGFALLIGLRVAFGPYRALAGQPAALFRPVWFLEPIGGMPPFWAIAALQVVGVAAPALAIVGIRRRAAFGVAWLSLLLLAGLRTSLGKVLHNDALLVLACVPLLAARDDEDEAVSGWPVRAALVVVAAAYFSAGIAKLRFSGLAWVTSDNMRNVFYDAASGGRAFTDQIALGVADRPWLATASAMFILAFELSFPITLFAMRTRPAFAIAAVVLHAGTWLTLGLDYWLWAAIVPLLLVDWTAVVPTRRPRVPA